MLAYLVVLKNQQGSTFKTIAKNLRRVEEKAGFDAFPFSQVKNASKQFFLNILFGRRLVLQSIKWSNCIIRNVKIIFGNNLSSTHQHTKPYLHTSFGVKYLRVIFARNLLLFREILKSYLSLHRTRLKHLIREINIEYETCTFRSMAEKYYEWSDNVWQQKRIFNKATSISLISLNLQ